MEYLNLLLWLSSELIKHCIGRHGSIKRVRQHEKKSNMDTINGANSKSLGWLIFNKLFHESQSLGHLLGVINIKRNGTGSKLDEVSEVGLDEKGYIAGLLLCLLFLEFLRKILRDGLCTRHNIHWDASEVGDMCTEGPSSNTVNEFVKEQELFFLVVDHCLHVHVANVRMMSEVVGEGRVVCREARKSKRVCSELM